MGWVGEVLSTTLWGGVQRLERGIKFIRNGENRPLLLGNAGWHRFGELAHLRIRA